MANYTKTVWTDEVPASTPVKYEIVDDVSGEIAGSATIAPVTGITPGTELNATHLNNIEDGVEALNTHDHSATPGAQIPSGGIAANAVIAGKIADGAVNTTAKLVDSIVTAAKIANRTRTVFIPPALNGDYALDVAYQGIAMPDSAYSEVNGWFRVPDDYVSDGAIAPIVLPAASGNIYDSYTVFYNGDGENYSGNSQSKAGGTQAVTNNLFKKLATLTLTWIAAGDFGLIRYARDSTQGSDTVSAIVYCVGFVFTYTADS